MVVSVNLGRLMTETSCFMDKRGDETTHYLKPPQAYIATIIFVGTIKRKAQPQQIQIQDNLIACVEQQAHNPQQSGFPQKS